MNNEGQTVEYKERYTDSIKKEVVAFANSQGGSIFLGVDDDGTPIGLEDADDVIVRASNAVRDGIRPDVTMFVEYAAEQIDGKDCIRISVQRGSSRPYYLSDKGMKPSGVYVRQGASCAPVSEEAIRRMITETDGTAFESVRSLNQDLSFNYASVEFAKRSVAFGGAQMQTLGMVDENGLYTNLALLFSDQCPHTIKAAYFEGTQKTAFKDRREFGGSILKQLADCYTYIDLLNKTRATFEGLDRIDERDYPAEAIREALLNCVVHRDYAFSGSILISIFEDRMEFVSLGGLVPGLTKEAIMIGVSQPRNRHLADIFYRMRLIEAYGTGIGKIMACYDQQTTKPLIEAVDSAFRVTLPNIHYKVQSEFPIALTDSQQRILALLKQKNAITRRDVEKLLGVGQTSAITQLKELMNVGLLLRDNEGKNIKYVLCEQAR